MLVDVMLGRGLGKGGMRLRVRPTPIVSIHSALEKKTGFVARMFAAYVPGLVKLFGAWSKCITYVSY